jgi:hypothetical protein
MMINIEIGYELLSSVLDSFFNKYDKNFYKDRLTKQQFEFHSSSDKVSFNSSAIKIVQSYLKMIPENPDMVKDFYEKYVRTTKTELADLSNRIRLNYASLEIVEDDLIDACRTNTFSSELAERFDILITERIKLTEEYLILLKRYKDETITNI